MCERHTWPTPTFDDIDWDIFRTAARTYETSDVTLMKLIHDKLPTNHIKAKYSHLISDRCHFCDQSETFHHLCTTSCNPHSLQFREKLRQEIKGHFSKFRASNPFRKLYFRALQTWFHPVDHDTMCSPEAAWHQQTQIGWYPMFRSFLSQEWRNLLHRSSGIHHNVQWLP